MREMRTLNERLNISVFEAPRYAACLDIRQEINYLEIIFIYCADNNLDAPSIKNEEFNHASDALENFCKIAKNDGKEKVYFWIKAK